MPNGADQSLGFSVVGVEEGKINGWIAQSFQPESSNKHCYNREKFKLYMKTMNKISFFSLTYIVCINFGINKKNLMPAECIALLN